MADDLLTLPPVKVTAAPIQPVASSDKPSFLIRILKVVVTLQSGTTYTFDGTPQSFSPFVPGLRIEADIENVVLPSPGGNAAIWIHGATLDEINAMSVAGTLWRTVPGMTVQVWAGDSSDASNLTLIHHGQVLEARPEFEGMPDVAFFISSSPGLPLQMDNTVTPTSVNGAVSAQTMLQQICAKVGVTLDYNGDDVMLSYHYTAGSAWDQVVDVIYAARLRSWFDGVANTLHVTPQTSGLPAGPVTISPDNGMIGYPSFEAALIHVRTIFDQSIAAVVKGPLNQIQVQSQLAAAQGAFVVQNMRFNLSCNDPDGGPWEIDITANQAQGGKSGD